MTIDKQDDNWNEDMQNYLLLISMHYHIEDLIFEFVCLNQIEVGFFKGTSVEWQEAFRFQFNEASNNWATIMITYKHFNGLVKNEF